VFTITLVLAAAAGRPKGDISDRIVLHAALTQNEMLDPGAHGAVATWPAERTLPDGTIRPLDLVRVESVWLLRSTRHEDEPFWRVEARSVRPGEYVTLTRPDGEMLTYRVVGVERHAAEAADQAEVPPPA